MKYHQLKPNHTYDVVNDGVTNNIDIRFTTADKQHLYAVEHPFVLIDTDTGQTLRVSVAAQFVEVFRKMTVSQALAEGYELFGIADQDYQTTKQIKLEFDDFHKDGYTLFLFDKEPRYYGISPEELRDFVIESYHGDGDFSGDDTEDVDNEATKHLPMFTEMAEKINKEIFSSKPLWRLTNIQLVPDGE